MLNGTGIIFFGIVQLLRASSVEQGTERPETHENGADWQPLVAVAFDANHTAEEAVRGLG